MIVDNLANASKYVALHPLFEQAFAYIKATDLASLEIGKFDIADGIKGIVSDKPGTTEEASTSKFECHNNNIDIQVCIRGNEKIGWKSRNTCTSQKGEYNPEKDVLFFNDAPDTFFEISDNHFTIFYPEDVHAPMIAVNDQPIKKLVIKVRLA